MSIRDGERIVITRRGSMLGRLGDDDLVEAGMEPGAADERCSRELVVHRAIYAATAASAIVHAHPVHTIARSFTAGSITPSDSEGLYALGAVPVVSSEVTIASPEAAAVLAERSGRRRWRCSGPTGRSHAAHRLRRRSCT